jgi:DNA-3-methyladenine glycosylase I
MLKRCQWCLGDPLYIRYHDKEWGVPLHNDRRLFEMLVLEGAQAGLSWLTVLKKRENYRLAFDNFDPNKVANYTSRKVKKLLNNPGIIRNRLKIIAAIENARAFLAVKKEFRTFNNYIWSFTRGCQITNCFKRLSDIPARTNISDIMSKDLKKRGFRFAGSTICYAYMQSVGMVNDHLVDCFRYKEIKKG